MNMSTNTAVTTRTRFYFFDHSLRECNVCLSINAMNKKCIIFPDRVVSTVLLLLCETSCPPQQEQGLPAAVRGLGTTDVKLHCCCCLCCSPVLLLLWFGHTHAYKNCCASDLSVEDHVEGHIKQDEQQAGPDIYRLIVTERRL